MRTIEEIVQAESFDYYEDFVVETTFLTYDDIERTLPARATLRVCADMSYQVIGYDYLDPETNKWVDTEESSFWDKNAIEDTFQILITKETV